MKFFVSLFALLLTMNVFAAGASTLTLVLEQNEVEKLDEQMREKGFILSKVEDLYAQKGVFPRCPCNSLKMTFTKVSAGKATEKKFNVSTNGFGTGLKVTISPEK